VLKGKGKLETIKPLIDLNKKVKFFYTRQSEPLGNGHALLCAREFIGNEPFVFSDGDSIIDSKTPVVKQLLKVFYKGGASVIGVQRIENKDDMTKYGNVYGKPTKDGKVFKVEKFVEKPSLDKVSPYGLIIGGMRYVFTKDIWNFLEKQGSGKGGEIWLSDAANAMAVKKPFLAYEYEGKYFDTGNKLALLKTSIYFALKDKKMEEEIREMLV